MQRLLQLGTVLWMVLASWAQAPPQPQNPYYRGPLPQEEERYADSAPESLIPSVPWPEWLPSDLASLPGNPVQWTGQDGNSQGKIIICQPPILFQLVSPKLTIDANPTLRKKIFKPPS